TIRNPCAKSSCSHLCLMDGHDQFSCKCPQFMQLLYGSTSTCAEVKSAVLLSTKNSVVGVNVASPNDTVFTASGFQEITAITAAKESIFIYDGFDNVLWQYGTGNEDKRTVFGGDLSECHGLTVDRMTGVIYYSSFTDSHSAIYAANDVARRSIIDSSTKSFDELLEDVSGVAYDRQGSRVLWLSSKNSLVMAMDVKTWAITPYTFANGTAIDTITVDHWTGDVFMVVDGVLVKEEIVVSKLLRYGRRFSKHTTREMSPLRKTSVARK
ncbi:hypothetical protein OSTOST_21975, partial [Ostertagia ostertagi]